MDRPTDGWRTSEAAILQAKSHKNRMGFLRTDLELCFSFARFAERSKDNGHHEKAQRYVAHIEKGYSTILRFLSDPKHSRYFSHPELQELTSATNQLRLMLDRLKQE